MGFQILQTRDQSDDEHGKNSELINGVQNIQSPEIVSSFKPCIVKNKILKYNLLKKKKDLEDERSPWIIR